MNTYGRYGNWIDYHSYLRTSLAQRYKWARVSLPCFSQKNTSKAVCTNWNLWWLQVSPLQPPLFSGDLGQGWPRWLGLSDWKGRTTLLKECLVHCESRTTFVECNKMNEMNVSMNGMPRGLWDSAQDKVGREHGEANMGIRSRNA